MLEINCPSCGRRLKLNDNLRGKQIRCPACKQVFRVQGPAAKAAPPQKQAVKPRASAPPPAPRPPPPEVEDRDDLADVGVKADPEKQARSIARRCGSVLQTAFAVNLIAFVFFVILTFQAPATTGQKLTAIFIVVGVFILPVIFVLIGGILLTALRGYGLVVAGCLMSFVAAAELLVYTIINIPRVLDLFRAGVPLNYMMIPLGLVGFSIVALVFNILGGVKGLLTLNDPVIKEAYR
jgi:hypothetical protein